MERFTLMADLSSSGAAKYRSLCEEAMNQIRRRAIREDEESLPPLCAAAAALALYRWALNSAGTNLGSFAAGDVKINKSGLNVPIAKQAWEEAEAAAAPYLADKKFVFERIQK